MTQAVLPSSAVRSYLFGAGKADDDDGSKPLPFNQRPADRALPFRVELWNETRTAVEQVLAVTAHGSIGYAAYYAATREFPTRYITLSHKNDVVSRWNGPGH